MGGISFDAPLPLLYESAKKLTSTSRSYQLVIDAPAGKQAEAQVEKMIEDKIIARVDEPTEWLAPAFLVSESCGQKLCFVCDFSKLNGF